MRIVRLAQLFELKYNLKSEAASDDQKINDVKQALLDAYNNYVNIDKVKPAYNILPLLDQAGEQYSKQIIALFEDLINDIDTKDLHELFGKVNSLLAVISELQNENGKKVRDSIHSIMPLRRETDKNRREMAKSKFENVVFKKIASILQKAGSTLSRMVGSANTLMGGPSEPQVKEPSKQEMYMFRFSPTARAYHLDNPEVFAKVWSDLSFKRRIIYLINSAKVRKVDFFSDPEVMKETTTIMEDFRRKETNEGYFEASEDSARQQTQAVPAEEAWNLQMQQSKQQKAFEQEEETAGALEPAQVEALIQKRDEEHAKRQQQQLDADRERLIRSDGSFRLQQILKRYK